jgi:hypothetical protein
MTADAGSVAVRAGIDAPTSAAADASTRIVFFAGLPPAS